MAVVVHTREVGLRAVSPRLVLNDSILSPVEKPAVVQNYNVILAEQAGLTTQANSYGITTELTTYSDSITTLVNYLATLTGWNDIPGTNVPINGVYFRSLFTAVYVARQALLNAINAAINPLLAPVNLPDAPTNLIAIAEPFGIRILLTPVTDPFVTHYEYRQGVNWDSGTVIEAFGGGSYLWVIQDAGTYVFWVKSVNTLGQYSSTAATVSINIVAPVVSNLTSLVGGTETFLSWSSAVGSFAIAGYEIRYGATFATAEIIGFRQVNSYSEIVRWSGSRIYWVVAIDVRNSYGIPVFITVTINTPLSVTGARAEVVDNNALLYWNPSVVTPGSNRLNIDYYNVVRGTTYETGEPVGSNGNSTFTTIFEQEAATYTYWVAPINSAGTAGIPISIVATISQPPDYVLNNNYTSIFDGTSPAGMAITSTPINFVPEDSTLIGPVNTVESWTQHFVNNAWDSPQAQVTAGFPLYIMPSVVSGSYEEIIDYGGNIPPTIAAATFNETILAGSVTTTLSLSYKVLLVDEWTVASTVNDTNIISILLPTFRFLRVIYTVSTTNGNDILRLNALNVTLSIKSRNDSGTGTVTNASTGLDVTFFYPFVSADAPIVQPHGSTPLIPVVIYSGGVNPLGFTVKLYTTAGAETTGSFSWTVRGY